MERSHRLGLSRAVVAGDDVILSTGATAQFARAYPRGYSGSVDILLDGSPETEDTESLLLPERDLLTAPASADEGPPQEERGARAPSVRMED
ncbi:MAG TPA: hypothetical protein VHX17_07395 [Candidatus Cybelea sp.]|jgi:hypothetical protein|nr:hypothetical protein [Candidatus Cybelea sp.]